MKRIASILGLVAAIALVWYVIALLVGAESGPKQASAEYSSEAWAVGFSYPESYALAERDLSTPQRGHLSISLVDKGFVMPEAGEGPTAITVDAFRNAANERPTAEEWVKGTAASNYKLGPGDLSSRLVGGQDAREYRWSGLYEGKSVVVATPEHVYLFSVTYDREDSPIVRDFEALLSTVRFGSL